MATRTANNPTPKKGDMIRITGIINPIQASAARLHVGDYIEVADVKETDKFGVRVKIQRDGDYDSWTSGKTVEWEILNKQAAWVLLQTIGENVSVSIIGVYDNRDDLEKGIRKELEHFWYYLTDDILKMAGEYGKGKDMTIEDLHKQVVDEYTDHLMKNPTGFTIHGRNFHWHLQEVTMNKNVE